MCGLIAIFDRSGAPIDARLLRRMSDAILHRGPDDRGEAGLDGGRVHLASRRLAIIDLSTAGHMPMSAGDVTLAYNGETYNFAELRAQLENLGHVFQSVTDTEVVLAGLQQWGAAFLDQMVGMFALAAWNEREKTLILARDPAGKKPLYYAWAGPRLYVASEIKALLLAPELSRAIDPVALQQHLTLQFVMPPRTMFSGICKLAPGEVIVVPSQGAPSSSRFWRPLANGAIRIATDHAGLVMQVRETLERAVARRMVADVPVGAYLSGGLDSSLVVAMMQHHTNRPVDAFTITYPEAPDHDESQFADIVAAHAGARLHRVPMIESEACAGLEDYAYHADEPIADSASISAYWTSRRLREHGVVVALVGEGADELFLGYPGYFQYRRLARLWRLNHAIPRPLRKLESMALTWLMVRAGRARHADVARRLVNLETLFLTHETCFDRASMQHLLADQSIMAHEPRPSSVMAELQREFADAVAADTLKLVSLSDLRSRVPEKLLMRVDKMSMAHSLEARAPFLDRELLELVLQIPGSVLTRAAPEGEMETKGLLRAVAGPYLPDEIIRRPKMGFQPPVGRWLRSSIGDAMTDQIDHGPIFADGILSRDPCRRLLAAHRAGGQLQVKLWNLLSLALWYQRFSVNGVAAE